MWLFKFLMQFPMLKSFLSNQSSATIHLFIKPQPWLFFHLCLLSPNMWWKAETFPSSHFCILAVFPWEPDSDMPASLFFLCRGTGGMGTLSSAPDCSAMLTPGCPREEFCCRASWASEGWSFWHLVCSEKVPTKMWNVVFQQCLIQLNVQAFSRDYSCLTKFDIVLQSLK